MNLDGVVDSSDKSTVQIHYQGASLGWRNLSATRNVHGRLGREWNEVTATGYAGYGSIDHALLGRNLARTTPTTPSAWRALNRYYIALLAEQLPVTSSSTAGFGPVPSTSSVTTSFAVAAFKDKTRCDLTCPTTNAAYAGPTGANVKWELSGVDVIESTDSGSCAAVKFCRARGRVKPVGLLHAEKQGIKQCIGGLDTTDNTLCWGWHGDFVGGDNITPEDNIQWSIDGPSDSKEAFEGFYTATDNSEPYYTECVGCGSSKGVITYRAEPVHVVPIAPTEQQLLNGDSAPYLPSQLCAVVDLNIDRDYHCEGVTRCAVEPKCMAQIPFDGTLLSGCPTTR